MIPDPDVRASIPTDLETLRSIALRHLDAALLFQDGPIEFQRDKAALCSIAASLCALTRELDERRRCPHCGHVFP